MKNTKNLDNIISKCLRESIEEYTEVPYSDWNRHSNGVSDSFNKWYVKNGRNDATLGVGLGKGNLPQTQNGDIIVYHACKENAVDGIIANGFSRKYTGQNCNCVGTGIYCALTPTSNTYGSEFGRSLIKCILVGGFKDFIIFNKAIREKYDPGATLEDEFKRVVKDPLIMQKIISKYGNLRSYGNNTSGSRREAEYLVDRTAGERFFRHSDKNLRIPDASSDLRDESLLNSTGIRGFVYTDYYSDGEDSAVVVVRDINSLIPYQYKKERISDHWSYAIRDEETFNRINNNTDVYWSHSGKYPKTHYYETASCGYSVVADDKGKYYVDRNGNSIFKVPLQDATMIDPETKESTFSYNGVKYLLKLNGDKKLVRKIGPNGKPVGLPMTPEKIV